MSDNKQRLDITRPRFHNTIITFHVNYSATSLGALIVFMLLIAGVLGVIACLFGVMLLGRDITGLIHTGNIDATTFAEFMMKYLPGVWRYFTAFTDHFTPGHPLIVVLDFIFAIPAFIPILALGGVLIVWGFKMKDNRLT